MAKELKRCWNTDNPIHIEYHDIEWGVPLHDDSKFFEFLALGGFQAGLTWWLILQRRGAFRLAFNKFDPQTVAKYNAEDIERLMNDPAIIRNKAKILAAINNARCFVEVQKDFGSFDAFIWRFVGGRAIKNSYECLEDLPSETEESIAMSRELRKKGFKFVGPTICYAFMQATGLVNDHVKSCFRYEQLKRM
jgi:DNA-3-methyladenine glycosylase I